MPKVFGIEVEQSIDSVEALRDLTGQPSELVQNKIIDRIDPVAERFIAASSLAFVGTRRPDGVIDVTPRGDPGGFIKVLDEKTLALPDRPGNNLKDTFENVICDGYIGLIFVVPGYRETLRVAGQARAVRDAALDEKLAVNGKPSDLAILVQVRRVLCHCPKAFIRGKVWSPDDWPERGLVPTVAEMAKAHADLPTPLDELEAYLAEDARTNLY